MKALVYYGPYDLRLEEIPQPVPGAAEVLIKVASVGICGSDFHGYAGKTGRRNPPMVMGHEFCGTIVETGSDVANLKIGQKVVVQPIIYCCQCEYCKKDQTSICPKKTFIGVDMGMIGGFSEYVAVPASNAFVVDNNISDNIGCLVEPFAVGASVVRKINPRQGQTIAIVGLGVIGLTILFQLRAGLPRKIFAVDKNVKKLELAKKLGAETINFLQIDPIQTILDRTGGVGVDVAIEAVGLSASVATAAKASRNGGEVICVGNAHRIIELDIQDIVVNAKSIYGVYCYSDRDFQKAIDFITANQQKVAIFAEEVVEPENARQLFDDLAKGQKELLRGLVRFSR